MSVTEKKMYLRTDTMLVTLSVDGGEPVVFDKAMGGGKGESLTLYRLRHSNDAGYVSALINNGTSAEVVCQPLVARGKPVGTALVYRGCLSTVRPDILDANRADPSYLEVSLKHWWLREPEE